MLRSYRQAGPRKHMDLLMPSRAVWIPKLGRRQNKLHSARLTRELRLTLLGVCIE